MIKVTSGRRLFVLGTGTEVGKTYVSGLITKKLTDNGLSAGYYKVAMSGNQRDSNGYLRPGDAQYVKEISGVEQPLETMYSYVYENAFSPHLAAQIEGNPVEMRIAQAAFMRVRREYEYVTIEGSGGVLCPIRFDENRIWLLDIVKTFGAGCIVVANAGLGAINAVGLTAFYLREHAIPLRGIVFNHYLIGNVMHEDNRKMCEDLTGVAVVACVKDGDQELALSVDELKGLYNT